MARPTSPWLLTGMEPTACSFAAAPLLRPPPEPRPERPARLDVLLAAAEAVRALAAEWDGLPRAEQAQLEEAMERLRGLVGRVLEVDGASADDSDWQQLD